MKLQWTVSPICLLSHDFTNIMVVVDRLTKFGHFVGLKPGFTGKIVDDAFINIILFINNIV